jgi:hypothetical protein
MVVMVGSGLGSRGYEKGGNDSHESHGVSFVGLG